MPGHLREVGAFAAEEVLHTFVAVSLAATARINVFFAAITFKPLPFFVCPMLLTSLLNSFLNYLWKPVPAALYPCGAPLPVYLPAIGRPRLRNKACRLHPAGGKAC